MSRNRLQPLFYMIIGLALFGFGYKLFVNPGELISQLFIWAVVIGVIYFIYRAVMRSRSNNEYSAYLKAAKKSKRKYKSQATVSQLKKAKKQPRTHLPKRKRDHTHLTVIEGKKSKKKNRALF
ncbi:SA1362 family protein [Bacillus sp. FJAT-47783]|uniref:SA1362 family protein n=1 Tax=Bacillus sp. FJAT-47783 TaxID=2922712 RepID=UPI001FAC4A4D|nr:SA1362 family protein [Bacillus sp. FJAT-47783]